MQPGNHKLYNIHALKSVIKPIDIPLAELGVQDGETLSPIDMKIPYPTGTVKTTYYQPDISSSSYEMTQIDGFSNPITNEDFPTTNHIGNSIEGWGN